MPQLSTYGDLFRPLGIRSMQLRNRIVMLPMLLRLDPTTDEGRAFYAARARGGVAAIITWATAVDLLLYDEAWGEAGAVAAFVDGLRPLVREVHQAGAAIGMQLAHFNCLPQTVALTLTWPGRSRSQAPVEWVAPSARVEPDPPLHGGAGPGLSMRQLTVDEIESIAGKFGRAAAVAREAGFDFIEIHGAHGTLPSQFFSPGDNHRSDRYGGDLARRMTFGIDCVRSIRRSVGEDYPIFFRIAAEDYEFEADGGVTLADSTAYAVELERAGVDCFDVSVGINDRRPYWKHVTPGPKMPAGTFVHLAQAMKQNVSVPVIAVGKINTPDLAQAILAEGKADLIGIGRQLIADPLWPEKAAEGFPGEIVACDSCNRNCCARPMADASADGSLCRLNPDAG